MEPTIHYREILKFRGLKDIPRWDPLNLIITFLPILFEKLFCENKTAILLGDFNANLLNYDIDTDISDFLDHMYCKSLLPHITSPTYYHISPHITSLQQDSKPQ